MEENCGGGQGLNWAVGPRRERDRESICYIFTASILVACISCLV
jgi:hypothetical protein